jgi:hypothetical protein
VLQRCINQASFLRAQFRLKCEDPRIKTLQSLERASFFSLDCFIPRMSSPCAAASTNSERADDQTSNSVKATPANYDLVELPPLSPDCLHVPTDHPLLEGIPADAPLEERRQILLARAKGLCDQPPSEHWGELHGALVKARWEKYIAEVLAGAAAKEADAAVVQE